MTEAGLTPLLLQTHQSARLFIVNHLKRFCSYSSSIILSIWPFQSRKDGLKRSVLASKTLFLLPPTFSSRRKKNSLIFRVEFFSFISWEQQKNEPAAFELEIEPISRVASLPMTLWLDGAQWEDVFAPLKCWCHTHTHTKRTDTWAQVHSKSVRRNFCQFVQIGTDWIGVFFFFFFARPAEPALALLQTYPPIDLGTLERSNCHVKKEN